MASRKKSPRRISVGDLATETKLGSHLLVFNDDEVVQLLRALVEREENQTAFARRHGVERARLNQILNGKRRSTRAVIKALGLRKIYAPEWDTSHRLGLLEAPAVAYGQRSRRFWSFLS
jgi:DNA-binding phage protein